MVVPDICPREQDFTNLLSERCEDLVKIVKGGDYVCLVFGGSGTAVMDSCLNSVVFGLEAIMLILQNVPRLKQNPTEASVRRDLLRAASLAGLAISLTQTAAAHAISYPLALKFGIPHGLAAALPLLPLIKLNRSLLSEHLNFLVKNLNLSSETELDKQITETPKSILKSHLAEFGVSRDELPEIARLSCTAQRMTNSATLLSRTDVLSILQAIY